MWLRRELCGVGNGTLFRFLCLNAVQASFQITGTEFRFP